MRKLGTESTKRLVRASPVWDAESGVPLPPAVWASLWCWGQSGMPLQPAVWVSLWCWGQSVMPLAPCCLESICDARASCPLSQSVVLGPVWCPCPLLSGSVCSAGACLGCSCPLLPRPICGAGACLSCLERQSWMLNLRCNYHATDLLVQLGMLSVCCWKQQECTSIYSIQD